jgi:imidazolonepropionase-like amidohydrolase
MSASAPLRAAVSYFPPGGDKCVEVDKVARTQIAAGADWVKMYASTGSGQDVSGTETYTYDEIKAAVDAAHAVGKRIAIHSFGPDGARDAVRAGTDSLEHAADMDDAFAPVSGPGVCVRLPPKSAFLQAKIAS